MHSLKNNIFKSYAFLFIGLIFGGISGNSQINYNEPLEHYSPPKAIQKNRIKSLVIFVEMNEKDIAKRGSITGKLEEFEFNSEGLITYRLRSDNRGGPPFIAYGKGCFFNEKKYNKSGKLAKLYIEDYQRVHQEIMTYDAKGNQTSVAYLNGADTMVKIVFEWEKGQMIKSSLVSADESNKNWTRKFDNEGRLVQTISINRRVDYSYVVSKDSLITIQKVYKADTLLSTEKQTLWLKHNRMTYWVKKGAKGELISVMNAQYDKFGNATSYYLSKNKNRKRFGEPINIRIKNVYDKRKLLVNRFFYTSNASGELIALTKIERFVFDNQSLVFRYKKGDIKDDTEYKGF